MRYQPLFDLETCQIACCEALIRWRHPVLGDISPGEFIPIAESISMIGPISEWVLAQDCNAAAQWPGDVRVAVNISHDLLRPAHLPHHVTSCLYSSALTARWLELEVNDSVLLEGHLYKHPNLKVRQQVELGKSR